MLQFDEYKVKLNNLLPQLDELEQALDLESAAREADFLEAKSAAEGFWDNPEEARKVQQKLTGLQNKLESQAKRRSSWDDLMVLCEMGNEEEDESLIPEARQLAKEFYDDYERLKISTLLDGEYDRLNAIVTLHSGAGGTEACDWVSMLYRMYLKWAEKSGFKTETLSSERTANWTPAEASASMDATATSISRMTFRLRKVLLPALPNKGMCTLTQM